MCRARSWRTSRAGVPPSRRRATDLEPLLAFYAQGREAGGFDAGIQKGLMAILASTKFLYRAEPGAAAGGSATGAEYRDQRPRARVAARRSSSGARAPTTRCSQLAEAGQLHEPSGARAASAPHARRRALAIARHELRVSVARRAAARAPWTPTRGSIPHFDEDLRRAFGKEMELFLDSVLRERRQRPRSPDGRPHVRQRAARASLRHPGRARRSVPPRRARRPAALRPVRQGQRADGHRRIPDRTSPVLRGAWIMEQILATPPKPPPPGVETNLRARRRRRAAIRARAARAAPHRSRRATSATASSIRSARRSRTSTSSANGATASATAACRSTRRARSRAAPRSTAPRSCARALLEDPDAARAGAHREAHDVTRSGAASSITTCPSCAASWRDAKPEGYSFESIVIGVQIRVHDA